MSTENTFELPNLTDTEELHVALKVFRGKRSLRKFVEEHGFDVLESCKKVVDQVVAEQLEEIAREEEAKKLMEDAFGKMMNQFIDDAKSNGSIMTEDQAREALINLLGVGSGTGNTSAPKSSKSTTPRAPRKEYSFLVGGEIINRPFARPSKDIKDEMDSNGYAEQWMLLAPESVEEFLADAAGQQKYKSQIDAMTEFFEKKNSGKQEDSEPVELGSKVEYSLALDIETAKDKFNIEMTEDFIFEGNSDQLSSDQEKLLIAISNDETVEGGIEAIEALN